MADGKVGNACGEKCPTCGAICEVSGEHIDRIDDQGPHATHETVRQHYHWSGDKLHEWITFLEV